MVNLITSNPDLWVKTMLLEEHGVISDGSQPFYAALATFFAFALAGVMPLISFVANWIAPESISSPFLVSSVLTLLTFFLIGLFKGRYVNQNGWVSASETMLIGGIAAGLAFGVGYLLQGLV